MLVLLAAQNIVLEPEDPDRVVINLTVPAPCVDEDEEGFDDEIRVCARKQDRSPHRLGATQGPADPALPRAEVQLSDGSTVSAETESADLGMARSQRVMVRWKLKF